MTDATGERNVIYAVSAGAQETHYTTLSIEYHAEIAKLKQAAERHMRELAEAHQLADHYRAENAELVGIITELIDYAGHDRGCMIFGAGQDSDFPCRCGWDAFRVKALAAVGRTVT